MVPYLNLMYFFTQGLEIYLLQKTVNYNNFEVKELSIMEEQ